MAVSDTSCFTDAKGLRLFLAYRRRLGINSMRLVTLFILTFSLACNVGCVSPFAMSAMETTGSQTPVVVNHIGRGQGEGFFAARYDDVVAAVLRAAETLSLEMNAVKIEKDHASYAFSDATKDDIDIVVIRRSKTMTSINYDVGWFGSAAFGHLMFQQMVTELHQSKSFLQSGTPETTKQE